MILSSGQKLTLPQHPDNLDIPSRCLRTRFSRTLSSSTAASAWSKKMTGPVDEFLGQVVHVRLAVHVQANPRIAAVGSARPAPRLVVASTSVPS